MTGLLLLEILYFLLVFFTILRVIYDTRNGSKALAYILFIYFVPIIGILFYFWFGVNYRKRKLYSKKIILDEILRQKILNQLSDYQHKIKGLGIVNECQQKLSDFIFKFSKTTLTANNAIKLLINGEEKFNTLIADLKQAKHHIHLEYYIFESDRTGKEIIEVLIQKAKAGVIVRFIYDDFGSHGIDKNQLNKLKSAGAEIAPFYKVNLFLFASKINYRNHRKIVIIDGTISFVGGINISDKYRNDTKKQGEIFWRDTHLRINGTATASLQFIFFGDWNFCSKQTLEIEDAYFPSRFDENVTGSDLVQIVPAGPDSDLPVIYYSLIETISCAKKSILITNPYLIPGESLIDALLVAAGSGVSIKIIVPGVSDSKIVNAAANSFYSELLTAGIEVYRYQKGFVHAKTMVVDDDLSIVGTSNMDYRSFDLNFEVNAMVYSQNIASELTYTFEEDLKFCNKIDRNSWQRRPLYMQFFERTARLLSPLL